MNETTIILTVMYFLIGVIFILLFVITQRINKLESTVSNIEFFSK